MEDGIRLHLPKIRKGISEIELGTVTFLAKQIEIVMERLKIEVTESKELVEHLPDKESESKILKFVSK